MRKSPRPNNVHSNGGLLSVAPPLTNPPQRAADLPDVSLSTGMIAKFYSGEKNT